jgi:hypothetical protein
VEEGIARWRRLTHTRAKTLHVQKHLLHPLSLGLHPQPLGLHPLLLGLHPRLHLLPSPSLFFQLGLQYFTPLLQCKAKVSKNKRLHIYSFLCSLPNGIKATITLHSRSTISNVNRSTTTNHELYMHIYSVVVFKCYKIAWPLSIAIEGRGEKGTGHT